MTELDKFRATAPGHHFIALISQEEFSPACRIDMAGQQDLKIDVARLKGTRETR